MGSSIKKIAVVVACIAILAVLTSKPAAAADDAVVQADHVLVQALEKGDKAAAEKLLDADFTWIDSDGVMWAKEDAFRAGLKPLVGSAGDVKIIEHKCGKVVWIEESVGNNYVAHFWVERPKGWRLLHTTEIAVRERDFEPVRPTYDIPCDNPCKEVPYKPISPGEKAALDEWQEQESSQANWEKHVADNFDQRVVSTYGGPSPSKADRIANMNKRKAANPDAPKVGAAPGFWVRPRAGACKRALADGGKLPQLHQSFARHDRCANQTQELKLRRLPSLARLHRA